MGEKKTSELGLVFLHLYIGTGFPASDAQLIVTLPFSTGFPDREHLGTAGGTERGEERRSDTCSSYNYSIFVNHSKITLHVQSELRSETKVVGDDDLADIQTRVSFLGVVDVQRQVC